MKWIRLSRRIFRASKTHFDSVKNLLNFSCTDTFQYFPKNCFRIGGFMWILRHSITSDVFSPDEIGFGLECPLCNFHVSFHIDEEAWIIDMRVGTSNRAYNHRSRRLVSSLSSRVRYTEVNLNHYTDAHAHTHTHTYSSYTIFVFPLVLKCSRVYDWITRSRQHCNR